VERSGKIDGSARPQHLHHRLTPMILALLSIGDPGIVAESSAIAPFTCPRF
jgi:hypothetical protein